METPKARINRKDWRALPLNEWTVRTFHAYFADMNAELYGAEPYLPMRNWSFEQGVIKRAITEHGPELLRAAFDECFRDCRPTRDYPILTAGFCVAYRINGIIPRLKRELAEKERAEVEKVGADETDYDALNSWL